MEAVVTNQYTEIVFLDETICIDLYKKYDYILFF